MTGAVEGIGIEGDLVDVGPRRCSHANELHRPRLGAVLAGVRAIALEALLAHSTQRAEGDPDPEDLEPMLLVVYVVATIALVPSAATGAGAVVATFSYLPITPPQSAMS